MLRLAKRCASSRLVANKYFIEIVAPQRSISMAFLYFPHCWFFILLCSWCWGDLVQTLFFSSSQKYCLKRINYFQVKFSNKWQKHCGRHTRFPPNGPRFDSRDSQVVLGILFLAFYTWCWDLSKALLRIVDRGFMQSNPSSTSLVT